MENQDKSVLHARVTSWFIRRMCLVMVMFFGLGGWFLYDGMVGYPRAQEWHDQWQEMGRTPEGLAEWREISARSKLDIVNVQTLEPRSYSPEQIRNQGYYAMVSAGFGLMALVWLLLNFRRTIRVDEGGVTLPSGECVRYEAMRKLDTTRWGNKGLATLYYEVGGEEKKGLIDGLKFGGFRKPAPYLADVMLERILERFEGELIELEEEEGVDDGQGGVVGDGGGSETSWGAD